MKLLKVIALSLGLSAASSFGQSIRIPNVFTPDGDGINDVLRITTSGYEELTCTIYNRHGAVVYIFYGLNGSWDAYTHAGDKVSAGVYWVIVDAATSDGEQTSQQGVLTVSY